MKFYIGNSSRSENERVDICERKAFDADQRRCVAEREISRLEEEIKVCLFFS